MLAVAWDEQKWLEPGRDIVFLGILIDFFSCTCRKEMELAHQICDFTALLRMRLIFKRGSQFIGKQCQVDV